MPLNQDDIVQVVSTIWQSVLKIESVQVTALPQQVPASIATCIQITGSWKGAVLVGCTERFAARAATVMFNTASEDRNVTDMQDALAELTNMIGGNLKGLLAGEDACHLSLPAVIAGADFTTRLPGSRLINQIALDCDGDVVVINVHEKIPAAQAA